MCVCHGASRLPINTVRNPTAVKSVWTVPCKRRGPWTRRRTSNRRAALAATMPSARFPSKFWRHRRFRRTRAGKERQTMYGRPSRRESRHGPISPASGDVTVNACAHLESRAGGIADRNSPRFVVPDKSPIIAAPAMSVASTNRLSDNDRRAAARELGMSRSTNNKTVAGSEASSIANTAKMRSFASTAITTPASDSASIVNLRPI